jgi:hypothetical protein
MERVIQLSIIEDDVAVVVASWASPIKDQVYTYTLRGRPIQRMPNHVRSEKGKKFQLCIFADGSQQWVNTDNIRGFKLNRFAGGTV